MVDLNVFSNPRRFFSEWVDDRKLFNLFIIVPLLFMLALIWIFPNVPELASISNIYLTFLVFGLIIASFDYFFENNDLFGFLFVGKTLRNVGLAFIVGALLAWVLNGFQFAIISTPVLSVSLVGSFAGFFFVVLVAPLVEEFFFRMSFYPTTINLLKPFLGEYKAGLLAILVVSASFAIFHLTAFGANPSLMFSAFIFSVIAIVGNRFFESSYFGFALHLINNFIAFGGIAVVLGFL